MFWHTLQEHTISWAYVHTLQASPSLPRAYERSLSSTSLHGMMLPPGLQQQLRLLTQVCSWVPPASLSCFAYGQMDQTFASLFSCQSMRALMA